MITLDFINDDNNYYTLLKRTFLAGSIRWIIYDGTYNLMNKNDIFYRSDNTGNSIEKYGTPLIKLSVLAVIILWNYLDI